LKSWAFVPLQKYCVIHVPELLDAFVTSTHIEEPRLKALHGLSLYLVPWAVLTGVTTHS
jgi:hypothetical protein